MQDLVHARSAAKCLGRIQQRGWQMQGMTLDRVCLAVVRAAASTRPRYIHLGFWGTFLAIAVSARGDPIPGRPDMIGWLFGVMVLGECALATCIAVVFGRYLTRAELRVGLFPCVALALSVILGLGARFATALQAPPAVVQVLPAVTVLILGAALLGMFATFVIAGRALRRLRYTVRADEATDFAIWLFLWRYFMFGAAIVNPVLRRALAIERA